MPKKLGFTLIELLVVVAIIAILSVIGTAIFSQAQGKARDAKRRVDVDTIVKVYEQKYKPLSAQYSPISKTDFTSGQIPTPPGGGNYTGYDTVNTVSGFQICAKLEGFTGTCPATGADQDKCYCRSSSLGRLATTGTTPPPPPPPPPVTTFKRVFATSTSYNPTVLGGVTGATTKCQQRASTAGLGGSWKAWLSTQSATGEVSPSNQTDGDPWTQFSGEYRLVDNTTKVADNWTDLTDGTIDNGISKNEFGAFITDNTRAWTNTHTNGFSATPDQHCNNWTSNVGFGVTGITAASITNFNWTRESGAGDCASSFRLYCFEQ